MKLERTSGILLHISSLPGKYGIGTIGPEAFHFADLLKKAGHTYWQILPIGPVDGSLGYSPYASASTFAGNHLLISPEKLAEEEWSAIKLEPASTNENHFVDFEDVSAHTLPVLEAAFQQFFVRAGENELKSYHDFCENNKFWLDDFALYSAAAEHYGTNNWLKWEDEVSLRIPAALEKLAATLEIKIKYHKFIQYIFFKHWTDLKNYCNNIGIKIIGDIPIYITLESADAWSNPEILLLDSKTREPITVAGVPPDYFSETGQRWGNPIYKWNSGKDLDEKTYSWWVKRISHTNSLVDIIRIDHFRGFEAFWEIPFEEETAINGEWTKGPGIAFFNRLLEEQGELPLIAEDLGVITPEVEKLRDDLELPGMKILQFAFDFDNKNFYLPHNITDQNCILYTGTHDNNTTNGWFYGSEVDENKRNYILEYTGAENFQDMNWKLIRQAFRSIADTVIIPAQDILGYGSEFRMNTPGTIEKNWAWKLMDGSITEEMVQKLRRMGEIYDRVREKE